MADDRTLDRAYIERTGRAVDRQLATQRDQARADAACQRCKVIDAAVPPEAQLKILVTEDWDPKQLAFVPRVMNQEQAVAAKLLESAIGGYVQAFGVETAGARLAATLEILRAQVISYRITGRILSAREDINARARAQYARGDIAAAHEIEAEETPAYDGKGADDAWLAGRMGQ